MKILQETHEYDDIIGLERPLSRKHPPMAPENRAAQFSPFAALTGYEEAIEETARLTDEKKALSEMQQEALNEQLSALENGMPGVRITYFVPDERKEGGQYVTVTAQVRRVDRPGRRLILADRSTVSLDDIWEIEPV